MSSHLRDFGMVSSTIWTSERFSSLANLSDRLAYIWLHCSQKTSAGVLRIGPAHMTDELDFIENMEEAEAAFNALEEAGLIIRQRPFVIITKFLRFNPVKSYRHAIAAWKEAISLQKGDAKNELYRELKTHKGTRDLLEWRDKNGNLHDVIFEIQKFAEDVESSLSATSDTPPEPLGNPSGKPITILKNENVESRLPPNKQTDASKSDLRVAEKRQKLLGPLPLTVAAAKRLGAL